MKLDLSGKERVALVHAVEREIEFYKDNIDPARGEAIRDSQITTIRTLEGLLAYIGY